MAIICFACYHAVKSIWGSVERQVSIYDQIQALKLAQKQAQEANKDLADGLSNYKSDSGLERLARERLNLVGKDELMVRIGK